MNIEARQLPREQRARARIIDVDIRPKASAQDLRPFLSQRWWDHLQTYRDARPAGFRQGLPLSQEPAAGLAPRFLASGWRAAGQQPRFHVPAASRFLRDRICDHESPTRPPGRGDQNDEFSAAMAFAANGFQLEGLEPALIRAFWPSVVVPYEDGEAARARKSNGGRVIAALPMCCCAAAPASLMGKKRVLAHLRGRPRRSAFRIGVHVFGTSGRAASNSGWPSFYIEDMTEHASLAAGLRSR